MVQGCVGCTSYWEQSSKYDYGASTYERATVMFSEYFAALRQIHLG